MAASCLAFYRVSKSFSVGHAAERVLCLGIIVVREYYTYVNALEQEIGLTGWTSVMRPTTLEWACRLQPRMRPPGPSSSPFLQTHPSSPPHSSLKCGDPSTCALSSYTGASEAFGAMCIVALSATTHFSKCLHQHDTL